MASEVLEVKSPPPESPTSAEISKLNYSQAAASGPVFEAYMDPSALANSQYFNRKYLLDQTLGTVLLVLFAPLIGALWLLVKLTSKGPGFYLQTRQGIGLTTFKLVKLRSMRCDAEAAGAQWCKKNDPRVTPLGVWLRRLHLDELPQLWNVACGHMCLVGPRPERPEITRVLEKLIPGYHKRHMIKPGITGLAQVNLEPDTNINLTRKKQVLDLRYLRQATSWLDLRLLFATSLRMLGIKGEKVMKWNCLNQEISVQELQDVGYEFDAQESDLWFPGKNQE